MTVEALNPGEPGNDMASSSLRLDGSPGALHVTANQILYVQFVVLGTVPAWAYQNSQTGQSGDSTSTTNNGPPGFALNVEVTVTISDSLGTMIGFIAVVSLGGVFLVLFCVCGCAVYKHRSCGKGLASIMLNATVAAMQKQSADEIENEKRIAK